MVDLPELKKALAAARESWEVNYENSSVIIAAARSVVDSPRMQWCERHRADESAEEGTCEVAGLLWNATMVRPADIAPCRFVSCVRIQVEDGQ